MPTTLVCEITTEKQEFLSFCADNPFTSCTHKTNLRCPSIF
ncbi:Protein CBG25277 [Caenorhabditis briggsae]|uniref:Protein CBG25277 n=1 Tax=Caenorhabditis briggsae TaxID=6238 RepID=B6IIJ5_CAEBR|nr:Protein CBG25277 [Caenorhabditis briggsae]CAR99725.1 Protein CBG25277 [Caenorhabditis briggsae]